jgi:hypothetical protein
MRRAAPIIPLAALAAWPLLTLYKLALGVHLLTDESLWLQYKVGYFAASLLDAAVILYLLHGIRGPFRSKESSELLTVWGWLWRAAVVGFARFVVLLPFAYFLLPRRSPAEQTAAELLLLVLPSSVAAAVAVWVLYAPDKCAKLKVLLGRGGSAGA